MMRISLKTKIIISSLGILAFAFLIYFGLRPDSSSFSESENVFPQEASGQQVFQAKAAISDDLTNLILSDYQDLVPSEFDTSPYFYPFVRFWFGVYTRYGSHQVIIHDKDNLGIIYGVLDFSKLMEGKVNRFAKAAIIQKMIKDKISEVKSVMQDLSLGKTNTNASFAILKALNDIGLTPPVNQIERKKFFQYRLNNIRAQTGQRDSIDAGLKRMQPYTLFFKTLFNEFQIPSELAAIPFLESSFNNVAESKVGALGIWQFMPHIGNHFMPRKSDSLDYRANPFIASIAALHLLSENRKILKSWDLAVTAYNSGTKHLVKARRELGIKHLEEIFVSYNNPHIGFASKNFYAEFLALVSTLAYKDQIFSISESVLYYDPTLMNIGPAKCSVDLRRLKKTLEPEVWERFLSLNPHLFKHTAVYPRGTLLVSSDAATNKYILELEPKAWKVTIPHQWASRYLKRSHNCSTR